MDLVEVQETDHLEDVAEFLDAAYRADYEAVSDALGNGFSADAVDDDHTTALQIVAAQGNLLMMQILLNRGASVDKPNVCGFTPLLHAARNGKAEAVEMLIRYGANPCRTTFYGATALSLATAGGHLGVIVVLQKYESKTKRNAPTPLIAAIAKKRYSLIIYFDFIGIIHHPCYDMFYELDAFHMADILKDTKMKVLLRDLELELFKEPPINRLTSTTRNEQYSQVKISSKTIDIRCLVRDHQVALVDRILDLNVDCSALPDGTTPLMFAAVVGDIFMVQTLLRHNNYDIDAAFHSFTALMIAIVCGNDALTRYLIKRGASQETNGCPFSLFDLASNSDGISPTTIQLILTGPLRGWCHFGRVPALLRRIYKRHELCKTVFHQPIQPAMNAPQPSFKQKVIQNMGLKSDWVPDEVFDALTWPDCPCSDFQLAEPSDHNKNTPQRLVEERIMANAGEQEQSRYLLDECQFKKTEQEVNIHMDALLTRPLTPQAIVSLTNTSHLRMRTDRKQERCSSISEQHSTLFHFGPGSPKNISYSITSSPNGPNVVVSDTNSWQDSKIPMIETVAELSSSLRYKERYWDLLNTRCSPDVCQKLQKNEVDYETFLVLTKEEFISLGINRSDAGILRSIQNILKKQWGISF